MNKHAILIGVNEVPHLDYLSTPSSYAIAMNDWAISQGFKTFLFVDEPEGRIVAGNCSRTDILGSIRGIIEETDQLLIYFAGHGIESTATNDVWLLPGYKDDPSDCISISLNKALAYSSGVPHVIFISDACRSPSNTDYLRATTGSAILPKLERLNPTTEVDVLFSTWPGKISVDVRDEKGIYRSTYSDCLLECLHGQIKEVILEVRKIKPGFPAVMTDELNSYLKKTVPLEMEKKGRAAQFPMGEVNSRDPRFLARFDESCQVSEENLETPVRSAEETQPKQEKTVSEKLNAFLNLNKSEEIDSIDINFDKSFEKIERWRIHLYLSQYMLYQKSNSSIMSISGLKNAVVFSDTDLERTFYSGFLSPEPQSIAFNNGKDRNAKLILIGENEERCYAINVLYGFHTSIIFDKGELLTVDYYSLKKPTEYRRELYKEIAERKAVIISAAKNGIFLGNEEVAKYLRTYKEFDPILGLFASYAYFQKGNYGGVSSVYNHMHYPNDIIGDIKLLHVLSKKDNHFESQKEVPIPVLTEGWSYLKMLDENPHDSLSTLLHPGLWTSFTLKGLEYLIENYNFKKL